MQQLLMIAVRNLIQHRKRTLLLGGAIAGVTTLLVLLIGLSTGMRSTMFESATTLATGHVNVGGFYKVTAGQSAPVVTDFPKVVEIVKKEVPDLDFVTQRGRGWARLISDEGSQQVGIGGIDINQEPAFRRVIQVVSGSMDGLKEPGSLLVFEGQAEKLKIKVGDGLTLSAPTSRGVNNTLDVRVVAIARDVGMMSSWNVFIPDVSLRKLYQMREDATGAVMIYLKDVKKVPEVQSKLRKAFEAAGYGVMDDNPNPFWMKFGTVNREDWTGQKLDVTNWEDEISFMKWTVMIMDVMAFLLIIVLLVIIAIGVMNAMWIAIRERTREIGTLRAIGMQRGYVIRMFLTEAGLLGLFAGAAGAVLGLLLCVVLTGAHISVPKGAQLFLMSDHLILSPNFPAIVGSVVLIIFCTTGISLIPSFLAARLKPISAMHHIG